MRKRDIVATRLDPLERALVDNATARLGTNRSDYIRRVIVEVAENLRTQTEEKTESDE